MTDQPFQLDLFETVHIDYNRCLELLFNLKIEEAGQALEKYERMYPQARDLSLEHMILRRLTGLPSLEPNAGSGTDTDTDTNTNIDGLLDWITACMDLETDLNRMGAGRMFVASFVRKTFSKLCRRVDSVDPETLAARTDPETTASWYDRAGRLDKAIEWYKTAVKDASAPSPRVLARMGDLLYQLGDRRQAMEYFREALHRGPGALNWKTFYPAEVRTFLSGLVEEFDDDEQALAWAAAAGLIRNVWPWPNIRTRDQLAHYMKEFRSAQNIHPETEKSRARLFYTALLLCEQARHGQVPVPYDVIELRKILKKISPDLFKEYLTSLGLFE